MAVHDLVDRIDPALGSEFLANDLIPVEFCQSFINRYEIITFQKKLYFLQYIKK